MDASTAPTSAVDKPPSSAASNPAIVVPPGLVTRSMSCAGIVPASRSARSSAAAPAMACAAISTALSLDRPCLRPARAKESTIWKYQAGEHEARAWNTGK